MGFPDVCNTIVGPATTPLPYPNVGANAQAMPFCVLTKVCMVSALNMQAKITMTSGMEAGTAHPQLKLPGAYTMGNPTIILEKAPAVHLLCPTTGNNMNNALGSALVPSAVNVLFTFARDEPAAGENSTDTPRALDKALRDGECTAYALPEHPHVWVIRPGTFSITSSTRLFNAIRAGEQQGVRALALDLRGHRGGDARAALRIADDFLPKGTVIAQQRDRLGIVEHRARRRAAYDLPLTILVDGDTGSAAELLAGALQFHGRAQLAGITTFGKWSGQALCPAGPDSASGYDTVAHFLLPDGRSPDGTGLIPDVKLPEAAGTDADALLYSTIGAIADTAGRRAIGRASIPG
ncbi:MAG: S41 family peptidase [Pseudomonadota bacterium]